MDELSQLMSGLDEDAVEEIVQHTQCPVAAYCPVTCSVLTVDPCMCHLVCCVISSTTSSSRPDSSGRSLSIAS
jgi:hypothetical protein